MAFLLLLAATLPVWLTLGTTTIAETSAAPEQLIAGFAAAQNPDAFFYAINRAAAGDVASVRKAALARISDNDPKTRYAALYALALSADEGNADALAEFLTSPVADERLLAAGAMAGIRDKRALPVLIAALDQNEPLLYRGAGERVYSFARKQLLWFTGQDFGLKAAETPEQIAATKPAWQGWWRANGDTVHFDPQNKRFVP